MDGRFMDWLDSVRDIFDHPMIVTSGYRCPDHDVFVSGSGTGPHTQGLAADIGIYGELAMRLLRVLTAYGGKGIGLKQHGVPSGRYIHMDKSDRVALWTDPGE
jgi:uncharacterized protein YcbK (DUF882 family)